MRTEGILDGGGSSTAGGGAASWAARENAGALMRLGAALFWTLEKVLGDEFTPDVYAAWMTVFVNLSYDVKAASTRELAEAV